MKRVLFFIAAGVFTSWCRGYEINNHGDMSQRSLEISKLNDVSANGKLKRLGLKNLPLGDPKQTFQLEDPLGPIPYCFGSRRPNPFKVTTPDIPPGGPQDPSITPPNWYGSGYALLTIAQLIRYGACYEDEDVPNERPVSHFYNPQDQGAGVNLSYGPSSLHWMLSRPLNITHTGRNHYTWMDAREYFYTALTYNAGPVLGPVYSEFKRREYWGKTFQSLGHIIHHLQDMAQPQHVRNDPHCNDTIKCRDDFFGATGAILDLYRPSGYESHLESEQRYLQVKQWAQSATAPILFGLPREFWNTRTDNNLVTTNPTEPMQPSQGLAAYTSTHFVSAGKDFEINALSSGAPFQATSGLA